MKDYILEEKWDKLLNYVDKHKLIYEWVKVGYIDLREYREMMQRLEKT